MLSALTSSDKCPWAKEKRRRLVDRRTLSCLPKRTGTICGPMCRRCKLGHVCLDSVSTISSSHGRPRKDVRFGAVSSEKMNTY